MMINIYLTTRKIHRLLVLPIAGLTLLFAMTGLVLKFPLVFSPLVDVGFARYIHNQMSVVFAVFLIGMALTGTVLYFYPIVKQKSVLKRPPAQTKE